MAEEGENFRERLDSILATRLPRDLWNQVNSVVDDIEEAKWNDGWESGAAAYQHDGCCG